MCLTFLNAFRIWNIQQQQQENESFMNNLMKVFNLQFEVIKLALRGIRWLFLQTNPFFFMQFVCLTEPHSIEKEIPRTAARFEQDYYLLLTTSMVLC